MKIYRLAQLADLTPDKKIELGKEELGAENIGLKYQTLSTKEHTVIEKSSCGREEIIYIVKGTLQVVVKKSLFSVSTGEAFYTDKEVVLENRTDAEAAFITASAVAPKASLTYGDKKGMQAEKLKTGRDSSEPGGTETPHDDGRNKTPGNEMADFVISDTEPCKETDLLEERAAKNSTALIKEDGQYTISKRDIYR